MSEQPEEQGARAPLRACVVTSSTRAAAGEYADETGPVIAAWFAERGFEVHTALVPDGDEVGAALAEAFDLGCDVVVTTGGTGVAPTDMTPEQTGPYLLAELPGVAEALRAQGVRAGVPTAVLSRGLAGIAVSRSATARALVVNLPGSKGGVRDGLDVLDGILDHTLAQLRGGTH